MRYHLVTLISTFIALTCFADAQTDWSIMRNALDGAVQSEEAIIREQIARLEKSEPRDALADRKKGKPSKAPGTTEATLNETWFLNQHHTIYEMYCTQKKLKSKCSRPGSAMAHRDLNALQKTLNIHELRDRLTWLERTKDFIRVAKLSDTLNKPLEDVLRWKTIPSKSKEKFVVPNEFDIGKPAAAVVTAAVPAQARSKRLPAAGAVEGQQQPAGGGTSRLILGRPAE